jgi:hypothetical protein
MATPIQIHSRDTQKPDDPRDPYLSREGLAGAEKLATYIPQTFVATGFHHRCRGFETQRAALRDCGAIGEADG